MIFCFVVVRREMDLTWWVGFVVTVWEDIVDVSGVAISWSIEDK